MPNAVAHVLVSMFLADIYRHKQKKKLSLYYVFLAGLGGLLPDFDIIIFWILSFSGFTLQQVHRVYSHTLLYPIIFIIMGLLFSRIKEFKFRKHKFKLSYVLYALAFGWLIHLLLDYIVIGPILPFYPLSRAGFGLNLLLKIPLPTSEIISTIEPAIDAILLILWILHEEIKHKISDFF